MSRSHRAEKPCVSYFGNLCTGFGGSTICDICGWDWIDHPDRRQAANEFFAEVFGSLNKPENPTQPSQHFAASLRAGIQPADDE